MPESRAGKQVRAKKILELLERAYPDAKIALNFRTPFELLVATILSAQCTDERVNMVTPALFRKYPTARELARARPASLEKEIRSTGFFRAKTRSLLGMSKALVERHGGEVPAALDDLLAVARRVVSPALCGVTHSGRVRPVGASMWPSSPLAAATPIPTASAMTAA